MTNIHTRLRRRKLQADEEKAVKRAVSLPKALDRQVRQLASGAGISYSGLVREALETYLRRKEDAAMEKAYIEYYGDPKMRKEDAELVKYWSRVTDKAWLESERKGG